MRTLLEQPMRRSDFLKLGLAVAGAFFLCPYHRWEGTPLAEAAEDMGGAEAEREKPSRCIPWRRKSTSQSGKW